MRGGIVDGEDRGGMWNIVDGELCGTGWSGDIVDGEVEEDIVDGEVEQDIVGGEVEEDLVDGEKL